MGIIQSIQTNTAAMASPPLLHQGCRSKLLSSCIQPVALRPRVGQTLPSGRQCYSAVTSPIMPCKCASSYSRPASTIPGYLRDLKKALNNTLDAFCCVFNICMDCSHDPLDFQQRSLGSCIEIH